MALSHEITCIHGNQEIAMTHHPRKKRSAQLAQSLKLAVALGLTFSLAAPLLASSEQHTRPDALLQIDLNRTSVVEKIVGAWEKEIPAAQIGSFRSKLSALRADQLLAANVSGSFDGVLEVVNRQELTVLARNEVGERSKALGDNFQDLVYTPITPCRIVDTRSASAAGIPNPMLGNAAYGIKSFSSAGFASYGGSGTPCNIPTTGEVRAIVANVIGLQQAGLPNLSAYISVGDTNVLDTLLSSAALNFNAVQAANATVVIPTNASGNLYMAMPTGLRGNFIVEVSGYFMPVTRGNITNSVVGGSVFEVTNTNTVGGSTAVRGSSTSTTNGGIGVWGSHAGGGYGVYGTAGANGYGVYATAATNGIGVYAQAPSGTGAAVVANGDVKVSDAGKLSFGSQVRQMINLWGPNSYGIGVQAGTQYFRTDSTFVNGTVGGFAWFEGGTHNDAPSNAGAGGSVMMALNRGPSLAFPTLNPTDQQIKFRGESNSQGIGAQAATTYIRTTYGVGFYLDGVHSNAQQDPGAGGSILAMISLAAAPSTAAVVGNLRVQSTTNTSDRAVKSDFHRINPKSVLAKLVSLPVTSWAYNNEKSSGVRHIGPVAQDFKKAFEVGYDDKSISTVDAQGVAFAAIKGLHEIVKEKDAEIAKLKSDLAIIKKKLGL
jgi:Chaperone of endosialidase